MNIKKITAIAASLAILSSASFSLPAINADAASKTIVSSTFQSGNDGWSMYKESGGDASLGVQNGQLALNIKSVGTLTYSVQLGYDIIPLYKNGVYNISFDISSTKDRAVEAMIQQNGGTYQAYTWKKLNLTSDSQHVDYQFTMKYDTDIMSKFCINCGLEDDEDPGEHTVYLDNFTLELVDDSQVDYSADKPYEADIVTNQVGYKTSSEKTAIFRDVTSETSFSVVDASTKKTIYTGELYGKTDYTLGDETVYSGDFSSVTSPGKYYITCGSLDDSYEFEINDNVYDSLTDDLVRMLYLQRCGTEVADSDFSHAACHTDKARIYGTNEYIDVSGGWHDAGDYGRYVVPAAKTIADLLNAYSTAPGLFSDNIGIPESGNGVADILDEVRYDLEWMFKMQTSEGGVYHKVTCESFPGYVMPTEEKNELIVTPVSTTATADFCAAMAMGYEYFKNIDSAFAKKCLSAAEKAWSYLENNPQFIFNNPEDIVTGEYGDTSDKDERYWAAAQMYRATGEEKYLTSLESIGAKTGLDWALVGDYGNIALLTMDGIDKSSSAYKNALSKINSQASSLSSKSDSNPYGASITKFDWGSNMTIANAGVLLSIAGEAGNNSDYISNAKKNINYLLGKNAVSTCFVTGYGTVSPQNPHHRPSMAVGKAMKGMLAGGVNSNLEDSAAKAYLADTPAAKCYVDNSESYSTNEVTTYWNSPLIYLLALSESSSASSLKGDVNLDSSVNVSDVIDLQKYLLKINSFTKNQFNNADMNNSSDVNVIDLALLKRKMSGSSSAAATTTTTTKATTTTTKTTTTITVTQNNSGSYDKTADMIADFSQGTSSYFIASDGWGNGSCFDCGWYAKNAVIKNNVLNLTIDQDTTGKYNYSGAEYRTTDFYSYGYYETSMKAIKNNGVVSSFFTYTGPSDNNPWDEIDIEVLGKDTTKVQFNYYTNGTGNHEYMYDLGFDASEDFHTYGFDWQPDSITWYVDGKEAYKATSSIPSTPGKIMMNVWPGTGVDSWLNAYDGNTPLTAQYEWVTYKK